jgi:hypothetical protein
MATQKQFLDVAQSELEIDLGEISFMRRNGKGTDITFEYRADTDGEGKPEGHLQAHCRNYSSSAYPASVQRLRLTTVL